MPSLGNDFSSFFMTPAKDQAVPKRVTPVQSTMSALAQAHSGQPLDPWGEHCCWAKSVKYKPSKSRQYHGQNQPLPSSVVPPSSDREVSAKDPSLFAPTTRDYQSLTSKTTPTLAHRCSSLAEAWAQVS